MMCSAVLARGQGGDGVASAEARAEARLIFMLVCSIFKRLVPLFMKCIYDMHPETSATLISEMYSQNT